MSSSDTPPYSPNLLVWINSGQPDAWRRAEALRNTYGREGRSVLLRDCAELEIILHFLENGVTRELGVAIRRILKTSRLRLAAYFMTGPSLCLPPLPPATATFLSCTPDRTRDVTAVEKPLQEEPAPRLALVLTNDEIPHASKTSEVIAQTCRAIGLRAQIRDTFPLRLVSSIEEKELRQGARENMQRKVSALYDRLLQDEKGISVLALDLHWFFDEKLFLDDARVDRIISFWFDDIKSWCQGTPNTCFPGAVKHLQKALRHPKVLHCCYGQNQLEEMRQLGISNLRLSFLAAPSEYLRRDTSPEITNRVAFIGNPGLRLPPPPKIVALMERGAELEEIRREARRHAMASGLGYFSEWIAREPDIRPWLARALVLRAMEPYTSALTLLIRAGQDYPRALEIINRAGKIIDAALVVKMANQFDRAALVHRFHRAGLLDVYSNPQEWKSYGIPARDDVPFPQLPDIYQRYACHLNGYNSLRDVTANEKLFEIAACGRVSVNLASPDVRACYDDGEAACVNSLAEAEDRVRSLLDHPDEALAWGHRARQRTAREHLWEHRLRALSLHLGRPGPGDRDDEYLV